MAVTIGGALAAALEALRRLWASAFCFCLLERLDMVFCECSLAFIMQYYGEDDSNRAR